MAEQRIRVIRRTFQPAAVGTGETKALFAVKKGWRVLWMHLEYLTSAASSTDSTYTVGDGDDPDGFLTTTDTEGTAGSIVNGNGAYLATSGGKLYTADDTIDIVYAEGTTPGATNPKVRVVVAVAPERLT